MLGFAVDDSVLRHDIDVALKRSRCDGDRQPERRETE
jgi:hypothetical protein